MIPSLTYALVDLTDHSFLNWNLPTWKTAVNFNGDYINNHTIAIVKILNRKVVAEMSKNAKRPTHKTRVNLALAQKKYPLR